MNERLSTANLLWSIVVVIVAVVAGSGVALLLIPQLSLEATIRAGTIVLLATITGRVAMWWQLRRKARANTLKLPR